MPEILFFPFFGPNRHSDKRVIEIRLDFSRDDEAELAGRLAGIKGLLSETGVLSKEDRFPRETLPGDIQRRYSTLLGQTILLFQQKNAHKVDFFTVTHEPDRNRCVTLVEHEDSEVGMAAAKLAIGAFTRGHEAFANGWRQFSAFSHGKVLPAETAAIIGSARRRNIPFFQLERAPLTGCIDTGYRVRPNGLLSLGHAAGSHILDGTFCVDRAGDFLRALLRNPGQRAALMKQLGIPVLKKGEHIEAAERFYLLAINRKVRAIAETAAGEKQLVGQAHESLLADALAISEKVGLGPVAVEIRARDLSRPLQQAEAVAVDFDIAPDLNELLGGCDSSGDLLAAAADDLLDGLFPDAAKACVPLVAVTGTNGKTTTSRMLRHIFSHCGFNPGLVCTDGIFLGQQQVSNEDNGTFVGHARVLTSQQVNAAVLETHHRGIAVHGFAFQHVAVAVCLNVTEEHLAAGEIESVEEMAVIKRALVERASEAAVLFADDAHCLAMISELKSRHVCLVSLQSGLDDLAACAAKYSVQPALSFCIIEHVQGMDWIVLHSRGQRHPVMPVAGIPATFDGSAKVNVSNAMHAISAAHFSGLAIESVRSAMSVFTAGQEFTPGRLNVFDDLPFRIIMDFAHTSDGMQKLCEFADRQHAEGRKLVAFAGLAKRPDELNRRIAQTVAGHFDFYFCKDYEPSKPPKLRFTGPFMQKVLLEEGVPAEQTAVVTFGRDVIFGIFRQCKPGDLLFMLVGHSETKKIPLYIKEYARLKAAGRGSGHRGDQ